jgi:hypothetical protein
MSTNVRFDEITLSRLEESVESLLASGQTRTEPCEFWAYLAQFDVRKPFTLGMTLDQEWRAVRAGVAKARANFDARKG